MDGCLAIPESSNLAIDFWLYASTWHLPIVFLWCGKTRGQDEDISVDKLVSITHEHLKAQLQPESKPGFSLAW